MRVHAASSVGVMVCLAFITHPWRRRGPVKRRDLELGPRHSLPAGPRCAMISLISTPFHLGVVDVVPLSGLSLLPCAVLFFLIA